MSENNRAVKRLLFVCVENSIRSQMAEAFARIHGRDKVEVYSAGSQPSGVINPKAIEAMRRIGYDLSQHRSKSLAEIPDIEFDFVATMGCGDECPFVRAKQREDWQIPDPKHMDPDQFRIVRDLIETKVKAALMFKVPESRPRAGNKQTIFAFIERINAHDVEGLAALMSGDHTFIDAHGKQVGGKEKMIAGWHAYFEWFPDYYIEVTDVFEAGDKAALFGFAGGSFQNNPTESWRLPAAWKAEVKDGRVTLWQVFADTKTPFEIIERNSR